METKLALKPEPWHGTYLPSSPHRPWTPVTRSRLLPCWPQPVPRIFAQFQGASLSVRHIMATTTTVSHRVFDAMLILHVMTDQKEGAAPKEEAKPL